MIQPSMMLSSSVVLYLNILPKQFNWQDQNHHSPLIPVKQETDPTQIGAGL